MFVCLKYGTTKEVINKFITNIKAQNFFAQDACSGAEKFIEIHCTEKDMEAIIPYFGDIYVGHSVYKHCAHYHNYLNIKAGGYTFKPEHFTIIGGPCSIESEQQVKCIAESIHKNIHFLRGGAFKPRTSPYDFQGLSACGLEYMKKNSYGVPIISEITAIDQLPYFEQRVDIIQVGARNMQNYDLLGKLGQTKKPILLKRGLSSTIHEWLLAAEYIMSNGNKNVILCERGIRTFENYTRNTLDLSAVVAVKKLSCLPVIVDPSHACGKWWMIEKLSKAALAVGADGIMVEVHNLPDQALSDGPQSLKPSKFNKLVAELRVLAPHFGKKVV